MAMAILFEGYEPVPDIMDYQAMKNTKDTIRPVKVYGTPAYKLIGKRGAIYTLWRYEKNPDTMFVTNKNGNICSIKGNYTFSDAGGRVRPVY